MGSETSFRLPLIDFSCANLKPGTGEWELTKSQVRQALEEYGCFEFSFKNFPSELQEAITGVLMEVFDLPLETKRLNSYEKPFYGYIEPNSFSPLYESFIIDAPDVAENVGCLSNTFWPQGNKNFSSLEKYSDNMKQNPRTDPFDDSSFIAFPLSKLNDAVGKTKSCRCSQYSSKPSIDCIDFLALFQHIDENRRFVKLLESPGGIAGVQVIKECVSVVEGSHDAFTWLNVIWRKPLTRF